jgi:hypothetical protein
MNLLYLRGARSHVIRKEKKLKELSVDAAAQKIFTPDEIFCTECIDDVGYKISEHNFRIHRNLQCLILHKKRMKSLVRPHRNSEMHMGVRDIRSGRYVESTQWSRGYIS